MIHLKYFLRKWPVRFRRLVRHIISPIYAKENNMPEVRTFWVWLGDIPFYIADLLAFPEIYQTIQQVLRPGIRSLTAEEKKYAQLVFNDALDYDVVRMNGQARVGIHSKVIAYVTFNCIHLKNSLSPEIFIHEMMHVWQFQNFGSMYLFRAMKAQLSHTVYDFGGIENLYQKMLSGKSLQDFNFEQQAEIIETYFMSVVKPEDFGSMDRQVLVYFASCLHDRYA